MIAILRLLVFGFLGLSVVYLLVSAYSRSVRRETLENRYDSGQAGDAPGDRDAYIRRGMADYDRGLRKRLILLIYVVPLLAVAGIAYVVNAN